MSNKPAVQRRHDELYHKGGGRGNPNHDPENGQFTTYPGGPRYRKYIDEYGHLTDQARRRLNIKDYDPNEERRKNIASNEKLKKSGDKSDDQENEKKSEPDNNERENSDQQNKNDDQKDNQDNSEKNKGGGDQNNQGKQKGQNQQGKQNNQNNQNQQAIRADKEGNIHPDDQNKAMSQIEKQISSDYKNKETALRNASKLADSVSNFNQRVKKDRIQQQAQSIDLSNLSNADLEQYINERSRRLQLERNYKDIRAQELNPGKSRLDTILDYAGTILAMSATAASIAATIHTLRS